jgi:hypothetical protein
MVLYKLCVFNVDRNFKMTTSAGHSLYIGPIGSFYNQVNDTGSRHFEFHIGTKNLQFVEDHPMNIHVQFGFDHICSF